MLWWDEKKLERYLELRYASRIANLGALLRKPNEVVEKRKRILQVLAKEYGDDILDDYEAD